MAERPYFPPPVSGATLFQPGRGRGGGVGGRGMGGGRGGFFPQRGRFGGGRFGPGRGRARGAGPFPRRVIPPGPYPALPTPPNIPIGTEAAPHYPKFSFPAPQDLAIGTGAQKDDPFNMWTAETMPEIIAIEDKLERRLELGKKIFQDDGDRLAYFEAIARSTELEPFVPNQLRGLKVPGATVRSRPHLFVEFSTYGPLECVELNPTQNGAAEAWIQFAREEDAARAAAATPEATLEPADKDQRSDSIYVGKLGNHRIGQFKCLFFSLFGTEGVELAERVGPSWGKMKMCNMMFLNFKTVLDAQVAVTLLQGYLYRLCGVHLDYQKGKAHDEAEKRRRLEIDALALAGIPT